MREKVLTVTIKDCEVQTFRVSGGGGQRRDKRDTGVRIVHPDSGAVGSCSEHRLQGKNKREAFVKMANTTEFKRWVGVEHSKRAGEIDRWLTDQMRPENLLVEHGPF